MNGDIKRYIYIIAGLCIGFFALSVFLHILPWLLLVGGIGYIITKIVKFIKGKNKERISDKFEDSKVDEYDYNTSSDDYSTGEVIDVEYEDVNEEQSKK